MAIPVAGQTFKVGTYNIVQGVWLASLAHSLIVHGFHLCIYCMEGYCGMHGTSQQCQIRDRNNVVSDLTSLTIDQLPISTIFSIGLPKKHVNSLVFSYQ